MADEPSESLHWADQLARQALERHPDKDHYTVGAGVSPSGKIHVGNFREIITNELCARALKDTGKKTNFYLYWDNYDVFRKVPKNMPNQEMLQEHLRKHISAIPDPFGDCHESYAKHNEAEVEQHLPTVGVKPTILSQIEMYTSGKYKEEMKTALEQTSKILDVLNKYREEPLEEGWLPVSVYCGVCQKEAYNLKYLGDYDVEYECGCEGSRELNFENGGTIKLKWRIQWPAWWHNESVDIETAGKDHLAAGGSAQTGQEIQKVVYGTDGPIQIAYEWIGIKGRGQFASSTGNVVTLGEVLEIYEPEIVRYMFAGSRPGSEFSISFDLDVIKLYEDYDKCERIAFKQEEVDDKEYAKQRRIYELSQIDDIPSEMPVQIGIRHLTNYLLVYEGDVDKVVSLFEDQLKTDYDGRKLATRAKCAWQWIEQYAPDDFKWKIQDDITVELNDKQKEAIKKIVAAMKEKSYNDEELHELFYNTCQDIDLNMKEFFKGMYQLFINKDKGPRLASFVNILGDRAMSLMEKVQ